MRSVIRTDTIVAPHNQQRVNWRVVVALVLCGFGGSVTIASPIATRLRVTLEAPEAIAWRGELSVEGGQLESLQPLSLDPAAAAGTSLKGRIVRLHHRVPTTRDVFDVTVRHEPGAALSLTLLDDEGKPIDRAAIDLGEAMSAPQSARASETGILLGVTRLEADRLRVETERKSLLFAPGETFTFDVLADPAGVARGEPYNFAAKLSRGRAGGAVWQSESARHETPADGPARLPVNIPLPNEEGVYRVTLSAARPSGFLSRFPTGGTSPPLAERSFQIAVIAPDRRPARPGNWEPTYVFDPRTHTWADRVPDWMRWRRLPWFATGPLSSETEELPISPAPTEGEAHWRAYPLPIAEPGSTYAIEVDPLGEPGDQLTLSVLEPDALGDLRPISGTITHTIPRWNRSGSGSPARLIVRPRTASPLLVLANPSADRPARFGKIRLLRSRGVEAQGLPSHARLIALDQTEADLPHALGASHTRSGVGRFEQSDLLTYWETAQALADRVEFAGANAAVIQVNARGGAIYPSRHWASPAFDLGTWQSDPSDLPRRELLATILREFERRDLRVIPAVRFDAPTASMESLGERSPYDPASDAAAAARLAVVEELLDHVGESPAVAGIAIRASGGGWALLNAEAAPNRSVESVARLDEAYRRLAALVASRLPNTAALHLLPNDAIDETALRRALEPRLGNASDEADQAVAATGLASLIDSANPVRVASPFTTGSRGLNSRAAVLAAFRRSLPAIGATTTIRAQRQPVRLLDSARRLRNTGNSSVGDVLLLATQASTTSEASLLASADESSSIFLAGPRAAGWVDPSSAEQLSLLSRLPALARKSPSSATTATKVDSDLVARTIETPNGNHLAVIANRSAWDRAAHVTVNIPERVRGSRIVMGDAPTDGQWFDAGQHVLDVELNAYETIAWRFEGVGVQINGVRVEPAIEARRELTEALNDLQSRDTTQRRAYQQVVNPSFERNPEGGGPMISGWRFAQGATSVEGLATDGEACVNLRSSDSRSAVLTSDPFPLPPTGQLVLGIQVSAVAPASQARLQIELEEVGGTYRKAAHLDAVQLTADPADGEESWLPVMFPVDDLPLDAASELLVRFTLSGPGEVRIDDLRLEDLVLPLDGHEAIDLRSERFAVVRLLTAAENALRDGQLEACREHLESYWAQFLIENFPRRNESPALVEKDSPNDDSVKDDEANPSLSKRLRGYLPRWWR